MTAAHRRNLEIQMISDPDKIDALAITIQAANTRRTRFRSTPETTPVIREKMRELSCPVSGIWGSADRGLGPHAQERTELLKALDPYAAAVIVEGAGHWVQYEAAAEFDRALAAILGVNPD
jgi:2-hydroxy-6-oxonona-2,4-dienedioate hydrolase